MASSSSSSPELATAPPASSSQQYSSVQYSDLTREEVLEDLSSRFILNLPEEELASLERVCFQVEQAHWYYEDFIREENPVKFSSYTLKTFSEALFRACPLLAHWANDHDRTFQSFMQYKTRVPVCGAIMLNDTWDKCVLVKGWKSSAGWGFPKGKINEQEPRPRCAIREVLEETGYDLDGQLVPEDVIEMSIKEQSISLYIVPGVPEDYPFKTRTRKEISKIAWFKLSDLPTWKRSKAVPGKFYLISPFIGPLKAFIHDRKPRNLTARKARKSQVQFSQDVQVSSEDHVAVSEVQSSPAIINDSNAQESSSQSSSAEPQTPSPLYSSARVNSTAYDHNEETGVVQTIDLDTVDPHFARLLNSLSLSASAATVVVDECKEKSGILSSLTAKPPQPPPAAVASPRPHAGSEVEQHDWSAHVPSSVPESANIVSQPVTTVLAESHQPTPILAPTASSGSSQTSHRSPRPSSVATSITSPKVKAMHAHSASQASHGRRGSSATADISPYLSRPHDIPKEMKYISMLESVAKESDRMASRMEHRPGMPQVAPMGDRASFYPAPPASVPPFSAMHGNRVHSPVIYSSGPVAPLSSVPPQQFSSIPPPIDDPFVVRPRTSHQFHPVPYPLPGSKANLTEEQLQSLSQRNASWGPFPPSAQVAYPPFTPQAGGPHPSLRIVPPGVPTHHLPIPGYGIAPSLSSPAISPISPTFNLQARNNAMRAANNAHLLSILNSGLRTGIDVTHSGYTGLGPR